MIALCSLGGSLWRKQVLQPSVPPASQVGRQRVKVALVGTEIVSEKDFEIWSAVGGVRLATPVEMVAAMRCERVWKVLTLSREDNVVLALGAFVQNDPDEYPEEIGCFSAAASLVRAEREYRVTLVKLPARLISRHWWKERPLVLAVLE